MGSSSALSKNMSKQLFLVGTRGCCREQPWKVANKSAQMNCGVVLLNSPPQDLREVTLNTRLALVCSKTPTKEESQLHLDTRIWICMSREIVRSLVLLLRARQTKLIREKQKSKPIRS